MPTLFDSAARAALQARAARLTPDAKARWGRFTAPAMVSHLCDTLRQGLGDVPAEPAAAGVLAVWPLNWLVIHVMPWPKGKAKAHPSFLSTPPGAWQADLATLRELVERFGARGPDAAWPRSSSFGSISGKSWGVLQYRHVAHHLEQFGV